MENLLIALDVFDEVTLYDSSIVPIFRARIESADLTHVADALAPWVDATLMRFGG